jgi:hypothetical protein
LKKISWCNPRIIFAIDFFCVSIINFHEYIIGDKQIIVCFSLL